MNLIFLDYNTYGNRLVKKEASLSDYLNYEVARETTVNFNINDGVDTVAVVNSSTVGNYLIVADSEGEIQSRWFVIESIYKRNGQHFVKLHRDLMVDYWDGIKSAPCFIEKATLDSNDPAIFNKENMTFNQIKTSETLLKDETNSAWVVGYIPSNAFNQSTDITGDVILTDTSDITVSNISDLPIYSLLNTNYIGKPKNIQWAVTVETYTNTFYLFRNGCYRYWFNSETEEKSQGRLDYSSNYGWKTTSTLAPLLDPFGSSFGTVNSTILPLAPAYTNYSGNSVLVQEDSYLSYKNKIVYESSTGLYYRININTVSETVEYTHIPATSALSVNYIKPAIDGTGITGVSTDYTLALQYNETTYIMTLSQVFTGASVTLDNNRYHLEDSPYDMFCIPYSDDLEIYKNGVFQFKANKSIAINMAIEISKDAGSGTVYDVQLLPYCPVRYCITSNNKFDIQNSRVHYIKDSSDNNIGVILWATTSEFTFDISESIDITDTKLQSECDMYRLSSPNFNGQFEFNAAKNGGVSSFNVDCNYKPFNPYIHVNPNFGRLYGKDFNDARGLICGGDFSLPQVTNAWSDYQLQNKNFQQIFDRQIQNMEVNNAINNTKSIVGALGNAIGSGVTTGSVAVGVGSAIAGAADVGLQIAQQQETLDYTKDLFGYNLGNIQALPNSLSKTSAITFNNKIFPVLEYYTCTDVEKQALRDKITYNGMTVMRIGKIEDYVRAEVSYIKGQLIRLQVNEDNHLLEAIRQEVNKGVYV